MSQDSPKSSPETSAPTDFFSNILTPGSSLHPTFQLILDGAFAFLFVVLAGLAAMTKGNVHLLFLIVIECCLWASVKWFVHELQKIQGTQPNEQNGTKEKEE